MQFCYKKFLDTNFRGKTLRYFFNPSIKAAWPRGKGQKRPKIKI